MSADVEFMTGRSPASAVVAPWEGVEVPARPTSRPFRFHLPRPVAIAYALAFVAALLVYAARWPAAPFTSGDSGRYFSAARDLRDGTLDALQDRTPGYPMLLLLTGSHNQPTRPLFFCSLAMHFVSIWAIAAVLYAMGLPAKGLLPFGCIMLLPAYVAPAAFVGPEVASEMALAGSFAMFAAWLGSGGRPIWMVAAGVMFAFGGLVRPVFSLLPALIALFVLPAFPCARRRLGSGLCLIAVPAVMLGGYAILNYQKFGYLGLTPRIGFHLSTRTARVIELIPDDHAVVRELLIRSRDAQLTRRGGSHLARQYAYGVRRELTAVTGLSEAELARLLVHLNIGLIGAAPLQYLHEVGWSFASFWMPYLPPEDLLPSRAARTALAFLHIGVVALFWIQLLALGGALLLGLIRFGPVSGGSDPLPSGESALLYTAITMAILSTGVITAAGDVGVPRHRIPLDGLLVGLTVFGIQRLHQLSAETVRRVESAEVRGN